MKNKFLTLSLAFLISGCTSKYEKLIREGYQHSNNGDIQGSLNLYNQAVTYNKKPVNALIGKGASLTELGRQEEGIQAFDEALRLAPRNVLALRNRAIAKMSLREYQSAIEDLSTALSISKNNPELLWNLGTAFDEIGDWNSAISNYDIALLQKNLSKDLKSNILCNRGNTKMKLGDIIGAQTDLNSVLEIFPNHVQALKNRAFLNERIGNEKLAAEDRLKLLEQYNPQDQDLGFKFYKAQQLMAAARFPEAIKILEEVKNNNENDPILVFTLANARELSGDTKGAIIDYTSTIRLNPKEFWAFNNRGNCYSRINEFTKAINDYNKAEKLKPKDALLLSNRGYVKMQSNNLKGALVDLNKSLKIDPNLIIARYNRYNLYKTLGNTKLAEKDLKQAEMLKNLNQKR